MFEHNAQDTYHLRLHRAHSVVLTNDELVEMRAAQRTFEGAYIRTALGQFSFSLYAQNTSQDRPHRSNSPHRALTKLHTESSSKSSPQNFTPSARYSRSTALASC